MLPSEAGPKAKYAAEKALAIDPSNIKGAHLSLALEAPTGMSGIRPQRK